jgi:thiosulfate/3-mercaptopyruvate sulfurtransferase
VSLISAADLAGHLHDPDLRIADVRWSLAAPAAGRAAYAEAHLPGAVFVDLDSVLTAPVGPGRHPLPDPAAFVATLGALGIGGEHRVVAHDDAGGTVAARLWWMLDVLGHSRVAVLDGGIAAWRAAGLPLTAVAPDLAPAAAWTGLPAAWPRTIAREELAPRLRTLTLLDARAPERYRGEVEPVDPVAGHIPTAVSAPTTTFLGADGRFLAPDALRGRLAALGAAGEAGGAEQPGGSVGSVARPVVVACGSGVNACQLALAMRVAGLPDPLLYPGSYSDWSRAGMPIATGDVPGESPDLPPRP